MEGFEESLAANIRGALERLGFPDEEVTLAPSKSDIDGDFCTNVALKISSRSGGDPTAAQLAKKIVKALEKDPYLESAKAEKNGFINLFISPRAFSEFYGSLVKGKETTPRGSWKYLEVISANPTGYLHIGHARNGIFTDTLGNIFEALGYAVKREYLVNDAGAQIRHLVLSFKLLWKKERGLFGPLDKELEDQCQYRGEDMRDCVLALKDELRGNEDDEEIRRKVLGYFLDEIGATALKYHIKIGSWRRESAFVNRRTLDETIRELGGLIDHKDQATWLKLEKPEVLIKQDGTHTYFMQDIIYHGLKLAMTTEKDEIVNVWGSDHYGQVARLQEYIRSRGKGEEKRVSFVCIQLVKLLSNGEALKMSKRKSTVIYMKELEKYMDYREVRWFFVSQPANSPLEIDLEKLKKKDYNNPVYYVLYAHSRTAQLLKKAGVERPKPDGVQFKHLSKKEKELFIQLMEFESMLESAARERAPHLLPQYLFRLAKRFHSYYESEEILVEDQEPLMEKLALVASIKAILKEGLSLMEIRAPDVL